VGIEVDAVTPGGSDDDTQQVLVIVLVANNGASVDTARKYMNAEVGNVDTRPSSPGVDIA